MTPELQKMSAYITDVSIVSHVYTPDKMDSSAIPVLHAFVLHSDSSTMPVLHFVLDASFRRGHFVLGGADFVHLKCCPRHVLTQR